MKFSLFVSCQWHFWPFISCQLTPLPPSFIQPGVRDSRFWKKWIELKSILRIFLLNVYLRFLFFKPCANDPTLLDQHHPTLWIMFDLTITLEVYHHIFLNLYFLIIIACEQTIYIHCTLILFTFSNNVGRCWSNNVGSFAQGLKAHRNP